LFGGVEVDHAGVGSGLQGPIVKIREYHQRVITLFATQDVDPCADRASLEITRIASEDLTAHRSHPTGVEGDARPRGRRTMRGSVTTTVVAAWASIDSKAKQAAAKNRRRLMAV
jgi:hypothetical protein